MLRRLRELALLLAAALVAACPHEARLAGLPEELQARTFAPPAPGGALLYVVASEYTWVGTVILDGVPQGFLDRGRFFRFAVAPGPHRVEFVIQGAGSGNKSATFSARAGELFVTAPCVAGGSALVVVRDDGSPPDATTWTEALPTAGQLKYAVSASHLVLSDVAGDGLVATAAPGMAAPGAVRVGVSSGGDPTAAMKAPVAPTTSPAAGGSAAAAPQQATSFAIGAPRPDAFALVIGVEKYRDLPPPTGARGDAQRFAELARKTLGVPERNVILALDDRAAKSDLEKHLDWLENNVPAGGRIYLFFAGHGAPDPTSGTSYLLPYDADPAALPRTALRLSEVTARLGKTKAGDVVAFLDSCFSGTGGRSVIAAGTRPLVPVQKLAAAPKVSVLAAVSGAQTSGAFSAGGGLFSHFLFEALGNGKADQDGDGQVTLREVNDWIAPRVEREAKRDSREQLPSLTPGAGVDPTKAVLAIGVTGG